MSTKGPPGDDDSPFSTHQRFGPPSGPTEIPEYVKARLRVVDGAQKGTTIELKQPSTLVGRANHAQLRLTDDGISREHFTVTFHRSGREFRVNDLGSANGTRLNGSLVTSYVVRNGDKILAADTMIVFEMDPTGA